jgi:hypothetical protein
MAISYVGGQVAGRAGTVGTTSVTFALTGGTNPTPQPGDLVIITAVVGSQARNPAQAISGYTALGQLNPTATTYDTSLNVSYKVMGNTPDASFTLPSTGNIADAQRYSVQVFRDVDVSGLASVSATGTATSRPNPGSITPTVAGSWVVICGGGAAATGASYTAPANFTTNFLTGFTADTNDAIVGSGYWSGWSSGAVDPAAYTGGSNTANDSWAAYTIVLPPATIPTRTPVTFVDSVLGGDNSFTVSSISATAPSMSSGDIDIIYAAAAALSPAAAPTIATPSGFTAAATSGTLTLSGGGLNSRLQVFWKYATGAGSSATLNAGATCAILYVRASYSGPDPTTPMRQANFGALGSGTSAVVPALTADDDSLLGIYLVQGVSQTATPPGSMTEREDNGSLNSSYADELTTSSGSTGTRTFTLPSASDSAYIFAEFLGAPVAAGPNQTIAFTLEDVTAAFSQTATHPQSLAATLDGVAVSIAQTLSHSQTLAAVLDDVSASIAQTAQHPQALAITLDDVDVAINQSIGAGNSQAIAFTLDDVSASIAQTSTHPQSLAATLDGVTVALAQVAQHPQALAITLDGVSVAINQGLQHAQALAATLDGVSVQIDQSVGSAAKDQALAITLDDIDVLIQQSGPSDPQVGIFWNPSLWNQEETEEDKKRRAEKEEADRLNQERIDRILDGVVDSNGAPVVNSDEIAPKAKKTRVRYRNPDKESFMQALAELEQSQEDEAIMQIIAELL